MVFAWVHDPALAAVLSSALQIYLIVAAVVGGTVPPAFNRLGQQNSATSPSLYLTAIITRSWESHLFVGQISLSSLKKYYGHPRAKV